MTILIPTAAYDMIGEITKMLEHDALSKEVIRRLEADLNVYKRAYEGLQADHLRDQKVKLEVEKQNAELEQKLKVGLFFSMLQSVLNLMRSFRVIELSFLLMATAPFSILPSSHRATSGAISRRRSSLTQYSSI